MEIRELIHVEVAYAKPDEQVIIPLAVVPGTTVVEALKQSHILLRFAEIDLTRNKVGIFSRTCSLETPLRDGDRIEIYRPLIADPKSLRKKRAVTG